MSSTGRSEPLRHHPSLPLPVEIRRMASARRLRLRVDVSRNVLKLTGPARMNVRAALEWAAGHRAWIQSQMESALPGEPFVPGATIPVEGRNVLLEWDPSAGRTAMLTGDKLRCGGPVEGFEQRIFKFLRKLALETLSRETADYAAKVGVRATAVSIGDAGTRWGSCSEGGRIRYSWRLILAPPEVRRYVVAHEVAHLIHLNHGAKFKALEAQLLGGDPSSARALLRRHGPRLQRIGRRG